MVELVLTNEYANLLILLNGLAVLFYIGAKRKNRQRAMRFGNYETLQKVAGNKFLKSGNIILITRLLALTLLIVGISSPVLVEEVPRPDSDYVVALDSSSSMLAGDLNPTRFEASKRISKEFVSSLGNGTRMGFVTFAGSASKQQELTGDLAEVRRSIDSASTGSTAGTAIGDAISVSASMLSNSDSNRTVILITDGRSNVGIEVDEAVELAVEQNVTVHAAGIGSSQGSGDEFGTVNGENATRAEFPNLNDTQLSSVAERTGGSYRRVSNSSALRDAMVDIEQGEDRRDISRWFIIAAAVLLLLEWVLGNTRYSIIP